VAMPVGSMVVPREPKRLSIARSVVISDANVVGAKAGIPFIVAPHDIVWRLVIVVTVNDISDLIEYYNDGLIWLQCSTQFRSGSNSAIELRDRRGGTCSDS